MHPVRIKYGEVNVGLSQYFIQTYTTVKQFGCGHFPLIYLSNVCCFSTNGSRMHSIGRHT